MTGRRLDRLMNQELDGVNTAEEREALRSALEADREARERFEDLRAADGLLRRVEGRAPGPEFADEILARVRQTARQDVRQSTPWRGGVPGLLKLRYALFFGLGLGLGLGLLILVVFKNRTIGAGFDARQLVGTVTEAGSLRPAGDWRFDQGLVGQDLRLRYGEGFLVADVQGHAARDVDIILTFDKVRLSFDSLRQTGGDQGGVTIEPGRLEVRTAGRHGFILAFAVKGGLPLTLNYRVESGGAVVFARDLSVAAGDVR